MARDKQMALINGCIIADDVQPCYFYDDNRAWLKNSRHVDGVSTVPNFIDYNKIKTIIWFLDFSDLM